MGRNLKFILNMQAIALLLYGISMIPSIVLAILYSETSIYEEMILICLASILIGLFGHHRLNNKLSQVPLKTCYITTITVWLSVIILSALPYHRLTEGYSFIDCLYTSVASWSTCGTTAIPIESMPIGLLLWRSTCNWMGGIGIILLTLTFLPSWQFIGQKLASTEIRGPGFLMANITFRKAYRRIIVVYVSFTVIQYFVLRTLGMPRLTALLTTLSNTSTSGLLHLNNGVITAFPVAIKITVTIFALLASINISIFVFLIYGKLSPIKQNTELKFYLVYLLIVTSVIAGVICYERNGFESIGVIGIVLMQVISFTSTAGFEVVDYNTWSAPCLAILTAAMFMGACAISSGGGIKMSRISIALSNIRASMFRTLHPQGVRTLSYNGEILVPEEVARVNVYILLFMCLFFGGSLILTIDGISVIDAFSYTQAMITNTGTALNATVELNPLQLSAISKFTLSFLMLCGRLEIYPVLLLFTKGFFKTEEA